MKCQPFTIPWSSFQTLVKFLSEVRCVDLSNLKIVVFKSGNRKSNEILQLGSIAVLEPCFIQKIQ